MSTTTGTINTPTGSAAMTELAAVHQGAGDHRLFFNHLGTVKITASDSPSGLGAVEFRAPRGFATPIHVHDDQDEILYIIDGEVRLGVGDAAVRAGTGSIVTLPSGVPHVFQVVSDEARFLSVTAGRSDRPKFGDFVVALSDEVDPDALPEPKEIDPAQVALVGAAHGIHVLGPPPAASE